MSALFLWRCLFRVQAMMTLNGAFVSLVLLLSSLPPECPCPPQQPHGSLSDHVSQTRDLTDPEPSRVNGSARAALCLRRLHCLGPSNCRQHLCAILPCIPQCSVILVVVVCLPTPGSSHLHLKTSVLHHHCFRACYKDASKFSFRNLSLFIPCSDSVLIFFF